jgi:hypothetical protein
MNIDEIDRALALRNWRKLCLDLRASAFGWPIQIKLGNRDDIFSVIPADPIRRAIVDTCDAEIARFEAELAALGIDVAKAEGRAG